MLFTGDIESEIEKKLVEVYGDNLSSEILKVPHHGSDSSSTKDFITTVNPDLALISVGDNNKFGHPHKIVLNRYNQKMISITRTDLEGDIILEFRKGSIFLLKKGFFIKDVLFGKKKLKVYNVGTEN